MIIRKAMYGCGLYFFIQLAYNSPILCKFARNWLNKKTLNMMSQKRLSLRLLYRDATITISHTKKWGICI